MTALQEQVVSYLSDNRQRLFDTLLDLIRVQSENFITHGFERPCAERVLARWQAMGLDVRLYSPVEIDGVADHTAYLDGRDTENRPNVTAVIPGRTGKRRVMLLAHTDTMPIGDRSGWTVDPLGEQKDGRIWGRGANDDKCGIAAMTLISEAFQALGVTLEDDLLLTAYSDEEYGGGGGTLSACLGYPCDVYVNLDGGNNELWPVALGGGAMEMTVTSGELLDSSETVAEALYRVMDALRPFGERRRAELARNPHYRGTDMQRSAFRITGFKAGDMGCDLSGGRLQFSYYTDQPQAVIEAELTAIEDRLRTVFSALNVTTAGFEPMSRFFPYGEMRDDLGVIDAFQRAAAAVRGAPLPVTASCLTDLNLMLQYGSAASINYGLVRDFKLYGGAHQPDEFVECDQLVEYTQNLALFLLDWCSGRQD